MLSRRLLTACAVATLIGGAAVAPAQAGFADFGTWTRVEDPYHPSFAGTATPDSVTLTAVGGPVPSGTDIGYQSIDGQTAATSSSGWAFSPLLDFALAIDFEVSFAASPSGQIGIGFGIGLDRDGTDAAGVAMLFKDGGISFPFLFFEAAARVNDQNQTPKLIPVFGSLMGTLFAAYDSGTGDVTLGASGTQGAASASGSATFSGIQRLWDQGDLLASFFLRSDGTLGTPWQGGEATAVFSNLRVLDGTPTGLAPVPGSLALMALGLGIGLGARRRKPVARA